MTGPRDLRSPAFVAVLDRIARRARKILAGEIAASRRASPLRGGTMFREHRRYVPGDDPRAIDWNAFGRLGEPFVKVFEAEEAGALCVVLDASPSMGAGEPSPFETAVRIAAAFGYAALTVHGGAVAVAATRGEGGSFRGPGGAGGFLSRLSALEVGPGERLEEAARRLPGLRSAHGLLVTDGEPPEEADRTLSFLPRGRTLCVQTIAREDLGAPAEGLLRIFDPEDGQVLAVRAVPALVERYRRLVRARLAETEAAARRRGAAFGRVVSDEPFEAAVLSLLDLSGLVFRR